MQKLPIQRTGVGSGLGLGVAVGSPEGLARLSLGAGVAVELLPDALGTVSGGGHGTSSALQ
jgi:hypothetical protein